MSNTAKMLNTTGKKLDDIMHVVIYRLTKGLLTVVDRSTNKIDVVQSIEILKDGSLLFKFEDDVYCSAFQAVAVGVTKQIVFEW